MHRVSALAARRVSTTRGRCALSAHTPAVHPQTDVIVIKSPFARTHAVALTHARASHIYVPTRHAHACDKKRNPDRRRAPVPDGIPSGEGSFSQADGSSTLECRVAPPQVHVPVFVVPRTSGGRRRHPYGERPAFLRSVLSYLPAGPALDGGGVDKTGHLSGT